MEGGGEVVEDGDPPGIAGCSGQLGLAQRTREQGRWEGKRSLSQDLQV